MLVNLELIARYWFKSINNVEGGGQTNLFIFVAYTISTHTNPASYENHNIFSTAKAFKSEIFETFKDESEPLLIIEKYT